MTMESHHTASSAEREVTDPITHLPLSIHDITAEELENAPTLNSPPPSHDKAQRANDNNDRHATLEDAVAHEMRQPWWHDPHEAEGKRRMQTAVIAAAAAGFGAVGSWLMTWALGALTGRRSWALGLLNFVLASTGCLIFALGSAVGVFLYLKPSSRNASEQPQEHEYTWQPESKPKSDSANEQLHGDQKSAISTDLSTDPDRPESAAWLNSLLTSLWPIINPALFTSVSDMLEDAMQATLPKLVHGVRVADLGQGSEPMRVLAIRWLDPGDATVAKDGMAAEEGDFVNLELAVAYRPQHTRGGMKARAGHAHLLLQFWVSGGLMIPVWVDITGVLATARVRLQLTPNPPFLSLATVTLLGQPRVALACTPLAKSFMNIMDVPGLSGWLQSCVDSAVVEYVAPRSITLDLKTILMGREKMDTDAVGVVFVNIRSACGFKRGDGGVVWGDREARKGDPYVTLGWGKWGKPLWSTRIIENEGEPVWEETTGLLVGPAELNSQEKLRIQIWDSDRSTADDLLGTIEVPLKDLMTGKDTLNKISIREDHLADLNGTQWPGTLTWDVGYFAKTSFRQLAPNAEEADKTEARIKEEAEEKLREAKARNEKGEIEQQQREDLKERIDEIIAGEAPSDAWPTGILSINIEQITGLEVERIKESGVKEGGEDEESGDLPSAYCTIMINHERVYKTRTKLKSGKPYFAASTERFLRDWRTTTVIIAVRDARMHESDPLLGVVVLPLSTILEHRSQVTNTFPIVGGIGYGRMQLSLSFRSVQARLAPELRGWNVGTLDIAPTAHGDLPQDLASCRILLRTANGKGKLKPAADGGWAQKHGRPVRLAVRKRYAECLLVQFRRRVLGPDQTPAFGALWLKDVPDGDEGEVSVSVRRGDSEAFRRAGANAAGVGEEVGRLRLTLKFWPGLSGYHEALKDGDGDVHDVMEVLDCAQESEEIGEDLLYDEELDSSSDEGGGRSSDDSKDEGRSRTLSGGEKQGLVEEVRDFKKRKGQLHRKHRGLMQWKGMRNVAWASKEVGKAVDQVEDKVEGVFKHRQKDTGIDKEV